MSVKIKVSYNTDDELADVIRLLSPKVRAYKIAKKQPSKYKNAYIYLQSK